MKNRIGDQFVEKGNVAELRRPTQLTQSIGILSTRFATALVTKMDSGLFSTAALVSFKEAQAAIAEHPGYRLPTVRELAAMHKAHPGKQR